MSKTNQNTMKSEVFTILMIVAILLFIITSIYLAQIKKDLEKLKENQQPPLIVLSEAHGYSFSSSSSVLNNKFKESLDKSITSKIMTFASEHKCDIVEVYGYTDGEPFSSGGTASFDKELHNCLMRSCDIDQIKASSNLELGMQRAVSVVEFLKSRLLNRSYIKTIRPYSGGQFIDSNGEIADSNDTTNNSSRRRIEIRLSRSRDLNKRGGESNATEHTN